MWVNPREMKSPQTPRGRLDTYAVGILARNRGSDVRHDEDLTVANSSGPRDGHDFFHDFFGSYVIDPQHDFDLRQKSCSKLVVGIFIDVALLATKSFDFTHVKRLEWGTFETLQHFFSQKRFDDGYDLFHRDTIAGNCWM